MTGHFFAWREALLRSGEPSRWTVHAPVALESEFAGSGIATSWEPALHLDTSIRFHSAGDVRTFVHRLLEPSADAMEARAVVDRLWQPPGMSLEGTRLWATRDLSQAKAYLLARYDAEPEKRFGLIASSREPRPRRSLVRLRSMSRPPRLPHGVPDAGSRDPLQLRLNAYRVLLTRGRDGTVLFVPPDPVMDETWAHLMRSGFRPLE
jgi:hypothetical protein